MDNQKFEKHVLAMGLNGYTILPDVFTEDECKNARMKLEALEAANTPLECLFNKGRVFERIYQVPHLLRYLRYFLGDDASLSGAYGSIRRPGEGDAGLHSDGAITGHNKVDSMARGDGGIRITSHILGLNVIICLSDFTCENGSTHIVPGSFRFPHLEIPTSALDSKMVIQAPRGSAIVFNINTWHGPSANNSDSVRYALLTPWRRSWVRSEYDLASIVKEEVLERAGHEGHEIFGLSSRMPYLEGWQWDREKGKPKSEWSHLER